MHEEKQPLCIYTFTRKCYSDEIQGINKFQTNQSSSVHLASKVQTKKGRIYIAIKIDFKKHKSS